MEAIDYAVNVLLGLCLMALTGAVGCVCYFLWTRHSDRKEAELREAQQADDEQAQSQRAGGGGGPTPVR